MIDLSVVSLRVRVCVPLKCELTFHSIKVSLPIYPPIFFTCVSWHMQPPFWASSSIQNCLHYK